MARGTRSRKNVSTGRSSKTPLVVGLVAIAILAAFITTFYVLYYYEPNQIVQSWQVRIHFFDYRYGVNYTLPVNIGVNGGIWTNHTLDHFGPSGYAPLSTRDDTSTVYIRSNAWELYTFGDFFNIWGQKFTTSCVPMPPLYSPDNPYCTGPGETVVYQPGSGGTVDSQTQTLYTAPAAFAWPPGTPLSIDSKIRYIDSNSNGKFDPGETVVYANQNTNSLTSTDWIINSTSGGNPPQGAPLKSDTTLRFVDQNINGVWDSPRPPPAMSDGTRDACITAGYGLSNNEDWIIFLYTDLASSITGNCQS